MSHLESNSYRSIHHSFDIHLAESFGIECALMIHHFQYWIDKNRRLGKNFRDGRTWMYDTMTEISAHFPYWNEKQVFRIIQKLEEFGIIRKANYNSSKFDKTQWYAFENEEMFTKFPNRKIDETKNEKIDIPKTESPKPENGTSNTHTIPHNKEREITRERKSFGKFVKLSHEEYENLCKKEPKEKVDEIIEEINDHCSNNRPKGYDDYVAAFRTFLRNQNKTQGKKYGSKNQRSANNGKTSEERGVYLNGVRLE